MATKRLSSPGIPSNARTPPKSLLTDLDLDLGIGVWEGKAVFSAELASSSTSVRTSRGQRQINGPKTPSVNASSQSGSACSPISISSASPSPVRLSRPRAIPHYTSPLPRTAFTPPRAVQPAPTASQRTDPPGPSKPIHPFFARARSLPPSQNLPRYVAHYSSTEASQSGQSQYDNSQNKDVSQSTSASGSRSTSSLDARVDNGTVDNGTRTEAENSEIDQLADRVGELYMSARAPPRRPLVTSSTLPVKEEKEVGEPAKTPVDNERIDPTTSLPILHYASFPHPPKVAYTTDTDEANDLLSCLRGPVLGFDLEWPPAGWYDVPIPGGGTRRKPVGMTWNQARNRWDFGQGRTALMQFCDERLVVLIHLGEKMDIPSKAVEILRDPKIYKMGVQVKGDGQKLLRDFPHHFVTPNRPKSPSSPATVSTDKTSTSTATPSSKPGPPDLSLAGLLELSYLARAVDPIGTGPGGTLISLARLTERYVGQTLAKPQKIRAGNWFGPLSQEARDYAANDVWAALRVYKKLESMAAEQDFILDLDKYCSLVGNHVRKVVQPAPAPGPFGQGPAQGQEAQAQVQVQVGDKSVVLPEGVKVPGPALLGALNDFVAGEDIGGIAEKKGVKVATIESYICQSLVSLGVNSIGSADRERLWAQIPQDSFTWKRHGQVHRSLKREFSGGGSDSDGSGTENSGAGSGNEGAEGVGSVRT